jgi:integrase
VLPTVEKHEAKIMEEGQLIQFLESVTHAGYHDFVMFAMATGCRRGEVCAVQWPDINFAEHELKVSKSLEQASGELRVKTTKSKKTRVISLPQSIIVMLRDLRARQANNRLLHGPNYRDDLNLVFGGPDGSFLRPESVTARICKLAARAGLRGNSLHTLRHSHGSHLLSQGVPLPAVSKRLGHSSVFVTATVYSHALSADEKSAGAAWDKAVKLKKSS